MREIPHTIWFGVWLVLVPFLGIPSAWKEWLVVFTGIGVLAVQAAHFRRASRSAPRKEMDAVTVREKVEPPSSPNNDAAL